MFRQSELVDCGFRLSEFDPAWSLVRVVVEDQQVRSRKTARSIVKLAQRAGEWTVHARLVGIVAEHVQPVVWKGGAIPKWVQNPKDLARLSKVERLRFDMRVAGLAPSKHHNVLDAIGIGLWAVGRGGR